MSTKEETNFGLSLVMGRVRTFSILISSLIQTQKISQNHTNSHIYKLFLSLSRNTSIIKLTKIVLEHLAASALYDVSQIVVGTRDVASSTK